MPLFKSHKFSFELLDQPSTARAVYEVDGIENEFILSGVSNPLGDMLSTLTTMLLTPSHLWEEKNMAAFVWYCEEESYNWTLILKDQGILSIRITQSCEFFGDDEVEIVNGDCYLLDFLECIVVELDRFIKKIGLLNYLQQWRENSFPITYLLYLKKYLIENNRWEASNTEEPAVLKEIELLKK